MSLAGVSCFVGTLYLFYLFLRTLRLGINFLKTTFVGGTTNFKSFGSWAVVTGCTDGIGKAYAKQLASKGINIVLMSRSKEKLDVVASEIENMYKVQTKVIQIDFSGGHEIYNDIPKELEGLEIGVLVNNVGAAYTYPEFFANLPLETVTRLINVNNLAMTMLTRLVLPAMVERKKGIVINVSSLSGTFSCPLLSQYGATKSYVDKFSAELRVEYARQGITVQAVSPLFVATNMSCMRPSLFVPSPDDYVRAVLKKVGTHERCSGYWPHELQAFCSMLLPGWIAESIVFNKFNGIRERYLRKQKSKSS